MLESKSNMQRKVIEDVVPDEEDLVETHVSWDIGKTLGLQVNNKRL